MIAALLDHLWQSTLFAGFVGLLALALKHDRARIRYRLWLAASLKFLFPFFLLIKLGDALAPPTLPVKLPWTRLQFVQQTVAPFTGSLAPAAARGPGAGFHLLGLLFALWLAGFLFILLVWLVRWRRVRAILRETRLLDVPSPIPVRITTSPLGPGLFGIVSPVLLLPEDIARRLTQPELRAVIDHELCHWERNDNLTAAIHGTVEVLFWFHPLVWWLGKRLIAERERACDENVVESGNEPVVYAEGILKVCRYYTGPHPLAAAILSTDLHARLHGIINAPVNPELSGWKKSLIGACAVLSIAWPLATGWTRAMRDETVQTMHAQSASLQAGKFYDVGLKREEEDTTSRAGCESHFLVLLGSLEKNYGKFSPVYPPRAKDDRDQIPISLTWKSAWGASRYQEATVYMSEETAHVWNAHGRFDGHTIDASSAWSAESETARSVCFTEIDVKA